MPQSRQRSKAAPKAAAKVSRGPTEIKVKVKVKVPPREAKGEKHEHPRTSRSR